MNTLQILREKLQRRLNRLNSCNGFELFWVLGQFWQFVDNDMFLHGICVQLEHSLEHRFPTLSEDLERAFLLPIAKRSSDQVESLAIAYYALRRWAKPTRLLYDKSTPENRWKDESHGFGGNIDVKLSSIKSQFVATVVDYLDEQLDDRGYKLSLLIRYKQRCEWFRREQLQAITENKNQSRKLEGNLASDCFEYLFDNGVNFSREPHSVSGIVDVTADLKTGDPLVADFKVFGKSGRWKAYIIDGFHQVYTYLCDLNEAFGYMIIYRVCEKKLEFLVTNYSQSIPFVQFNGKTIFIIEIDIHRYQHKNGTPKTGSKRGGLKCHTITEQELVDRVNKKKVTKKSVVKTKK